MSGACVREEQYCYQNASSYVQFILNIRYYHQDWGCTKCLASGATLELGISALLHIVLNLHPVSICCVAVDIPP